MEPEMKIKKIPVPGHYTSLVGKITRELDALELLLKRHTVQTYWQVGRYIDEYFLEHRQRAPYGKAFYERLARDVGRDVSTLQRAVQFFRIYPIPAPQRKL